MKRYGAVVPSNIAFLKYWGKSDKARQWPANDSFSMTLSDLHTTTWVQVTDSENDAVVFRDRKVPEEASFWRKAHSHLEYLRERLGFTESLLVDTKNSFPEQCGIASSASGFGALTIAAVCAWTRANSFEELANKGFDRHLLCDLSRMGSGSACRSLHGGFVQWSRGAAPDLQQVESLFPSSYWPLHDTVVLLSTAAKEKPSSEAHQRAWTSPFFLPRITILPDRQREMINCVEGRDMEKLGHLLELEALEMHGVIVSATPPIQYLSKSTSIFLAWIRQQRKEQGLQVFFTIDAGPNVHLICEPSEMPKLRQALDSYHPDLAYIEDQVGDGPRILQQGGAHD